MTLKIKYFIFLFAVFSPAFYTSQTVVDVTQKGVYENSFYRNTFYTWTNKEQITSLKTNKIVLTKSKSETKGYSIFDLSLRDSSLKNNALVQLLLEEQFSKKRFAWVNAWATIMGWEGEFYGNQLIKIILKDSSIIGKFSKSNTDEPLSFYNMNGQKLTPDFVLKHKSRVAAVYHINTNKKNRFVLSGNGTYGVKKKISIEDDVPYREFVIVNESMIKQWSYATTDIKQEITSEINLLKEFQKSKHANKQAYYGSDNNWGDGINNDSESNINFETYHSLTCFDNNYYLFNPKKIKAIIKNLQSALKQQTIEIIQ